VIAAAGDIHAPLAPLPTAALRIEPETVERLDALGVRTIGDLLALPRSTLPARFGRQLVLRLQQALGEVYEGVTPHHSDPPPTAQESFETPLRDFGTLQVVAGRLLDDLFAQLVKKSRALHRVDCTLVYENAPPTVLKISLSRASRAWKHIAELVRRRLEAVGLADALLGVRITAAETSRFEPGQIDLFEPTDPNDEEQLGCLIDRLINRLGADAVIRAELADDYQPERAYVHRPLPAKEGGNDRRPCPQPMQGSVCPRPMQLLPTPLEIRVIALFPDGPPSWVAFRGREYLIARAWGPERIETGWWRGPDVCRDYFRALSETGEQFWVFRRRTDGRWFLHGQFV
jgi:protein ImuB